MGNLKPSSQDLIDARLRQFSKDPMTVRKKDSNNSTVLYAEYLLD
jgi:hypothetical protein